MFAESGLRSVTSDIEDRDISGDYEFFKLYTKISQNMHDGIKYDLAYGYNLKDYDTRDSHDSKLNFWKAGIDFTRKDPEKNLLAIGLDIDYKEKDYNNAPSLEYRSLRSAANFRYKKDDGISLGLKTGFIDYAFLDPGDDQLKVFTRVDCLAKLFDGRLTLQPSYKFQHVDRGENRMDRFENVVNCSARIKTEMPKMDYVNLFAERGADDTKDYADEDRDDNLAFRYSKWHIKTHHPLSGRLTSSFEYNSKYRGYLDSPNDYKGYFIGNRTDLRILDDKDRTADLRVGAKYQEGDFNKVDTLNYIKSSLGAELLYKEKKQWEIRPGFTFTKYDYTAEPSKNKKTYKTEIECRKKIPRKNLTVSLKYTYDWQNYKYRQDYAHWAVRLGAEYEF